MQRSGACAAFLLASCNACITQSNVVRPRSLMISWYLPVQHDSLQTGAHYLNLTLLACCRAGGFHID